MLRSVRLPRVSGSGFPRVVLALVLVALTGSRPARGAAFPSEYRFRTLRTDHVTLYFHQGLEPQAREAAALADEILARHERRYGYHIRRVHLVLSDEDDDPNGFTTPLPYPLIHLRAAATDGTEEFGNLESWMRLLLTHELAHSIHLEQARGLTGVGRHIFGRAPFLFPNATTPQWLIEGLATYEETDATAFGRGRSSDSLMVRRMAALENVYPGEDRATTGIDRWPLGQSPYIFGEGFLRDISIRFGEATLPNIARVHSGWPLPFFDELTGHRVTGKTFHARWKEFVAVEKQAFGAEAARLKAHGLTPARPLTTAGVRQIGARISPDGRTIAFTSASLTRRRAIHLMRRDGSGERRLTERNAGAALSWTPDGRAIVFDDVDVYHLFASRYDLKIVDVKTGHTRRLTRGLRARDPDVSPDGKHIAFVRRYSDRSELAIVGIDGKGVRDLTRSPVGAQWSGPAWHPNGRRIVASRWTSGGWSDLFRLDVTTGEVVELTHDRARDVEPNWTPDGAYVVFRSDRDGISNIYARRESDGAVLRATNVLGGAFNPAPGADALLFSSYTARGYDVRTTPVAWDSLPPADPFIDKYPSPQEPPLPFEGATHPYRPLPMLLPRFWTPYAIFGDDTRLGAATGGTDPLLRHAWALQLYRALDSERLGGSGFYLYDRFRAQLLLFVKDDVESAADEVQRTRELTLRLTVPLARSRRSSHQMSLAWRRRRETIVSGAADELNFGGLELSWSWSRDVQQFPYSISPSQGDRLRVAALKEAEALGSDVSLVKVYGDARAYRRVFGATDVLALRAVGGTTLGRPTFLRSFAIGGFPENSLLDVVRTNHAVLRGYPTDGFSGRKFVGGNVEYRVPLAHPERGIGSMPFFLRHLHAEVFFDAAQTWNTAFRMRDVKKAAGASLGSDLFVGHALPLTATAGVARGFDEDGDTIRYFRFGLAF
jgi:hypothetical protein